MDESTAQDTRKVFLHARIKRVLLGFLVILGMAFFFILIFVSVYFVTYKPHKEQQIPIADGRKLYQEMKKIEKEKEEKEEKEESKDSARKNSVERRYKHRR